MIHKIESWMKMVTLLVAIFVCVGMISSCSKNLNQNPLDQKMSSVLARHPEGDSITQWYETLPAGSLEQEAAQWILSWLPHSDLASLDLILLQEHVNLACDTYRKAPWFETLPRETWLHFVVPHRVSQEPLQPWRSVLRAELEAVVAPYTNMEEAALAVNRWCRQQATYIATSGRDMGPLTTIKRGLGRCEEEMILTICAMRAAGIPARTCSTPYWTFIDDNHAWVEVWADGNWFYAESCDDRRCLNDAWFSEAASRAGFVRSVGYGEFDPHPEPLYKAEDGVTIVNSTSVYTDPFLVKASVAGHPEIPVYANVLNYGTIRSIAKIDATEGSHLGPGSFVLTAAAGDDSGDLLFQTVTGDPGQEIIVQLDPETDRYDTNSSPGFWLTYPEAGARPQRKDVCVSDEVDRHHRLLVAADKSEREKLRKLSEAETTVLDSLPKDLRLAWDDILEKPCESFSPHIRLLNWFRQPAEQQALTWLLADADDKDLLELDERAIRAHVEQSVFVRGRYPTEMPDDVFIEGVLANRISREPGCDWRSDLPVVSWSANPEAATLQDVLLESFHADFGKPDQKTDSRYYGNPMPPHQTYQLKKGTETDLKVAFVGLCRRNGMPARYRHGTVECWLGQWQEVQPLAKDEVEEDTSAKPSTSEKSWINIELTRGGLPWNEAESYRHYMVSRPGEGQLESPWWDPGLGVQEWDEGDYWFCATLRVPGGNAHGRLTRFTVVPGETTMVRLPVDIDDAGWDPATLVDQELLAAFDEIRDVAMANLPAAGLYFFFEPGEPATRMIPALARLKDRLADIDLPVVPVLAGDSSSVPWQEQLAEVGLEGLLRRSGSTVLDQWLAGAANHGPVIMLVLPESKNNQPVMLRSGLDNGVDFSVHLVLDSF